MSLIRFEEVSFGFGDQRILVEADLSLEPGERVCLIGRNGAGKSSTFRLITGAHEPESGEIVRSAHLVVSELAQSLPEAPNSRVRDVVRSGLADIETLLAEYEQKADLLLLDEPTNHLDIATIEWLENKVCVYPGTVLFITHDRAFLDGLATRIVEIDRGKLLSWPGNFDDYRRRKDKALADEQAENALFDKRLAEEEAWIRQGIKARRKRNDSPQPGLRQRQSDGER